MLNTLLLVLLLAAVVVAAILLSRQLSLMARRQEAWTALYASVPLAAPAAAPAAWAASPEALRHMVQTILLYKPDLVIELGSGSSTVWMAGALERNGHGHIVSLDHEAKFAEATRQRLTQHRLSHRAQVLHAPLVPTTAGGRQYLWYDLAPLRDLPQGKASLLVVDGPPGGSQRLARYPALPQLAPWLAQDAIVLLDDAARKDEQQIARLWIADSSLGVWAQSFFPTEKGLSVLRRQATSANQASVAAS